VTYFNRGFPLQPFKVVGSLSGNIPLVGQTETGSATATVSFTATATGTTTRTGAATASVTFTATATGSQVEQGGFAYPAGQPSAKNVVGTNQSVFQSSAGAW
jgi:hypothetical protein